MYEILPPARTWPQPAEDLAQCLADIVKTPLEEAALGLLVRQPVDLWTHPGIKHHYVLNEGRILWDCIASDDVTDWDAGWPSSTDRIPYTPGQRAMVQLACSLAGDVPVLLGVEIGELAQAQIRDLMDAVAHAAGITR